MHGIVINKSPVDPFTLVHLGSGMLSYKMGFTFAQTLAMGFVWDFALEPELKRRFPKQFPYPSQDADLHALIDAITPAVGWWLVDWYQNRRRRISA